MGAGLGYRVQVPGEGVMGYALSFGTTPRVRAVPGPKLRALRKVSTLESSFDTSASYGGETKIKIRAKSKKLEEFCINML